jgi:hypothetical protein
MNRKSNPHNNNSADVELPSPCSLGLSATSQQYFSLTTNQPPTTSQQYTSLRTNQPPATSQPNRLHILNPPTVQQQKNADVPSWLMPTREKLHEHSSILSLFRKEYSLMFVLSQTILNFFIKILDSFIYWWEKLVRAASKDCDQRLSQPCHSPMSWFILPLSLAL